MSLIIESITPARHLPGSAEFEAFATCVCTSEPELIAQVQGGDQRVHSSSRDAADVPQGAGEEGEGVRAGRTLQGRTGGCARHQQGRECNC